MRKIKEVLWLHHEAGLSRRGLSQALNISYGSAVNYLNRAQQAGLIWPLPENMDERSMRQIHRAGEKLFVDYCRPTMDIANADTFADLLSSHWIHQHHNVLITGPTACCSTATN